MTIFRGRYESSPADGVDNEQRDVLVDIKGRIQAVLAAGSALLGKLNITGAAKGATTAADVTATAQGADHTGLDVQLRSSSGAALDVLPVVIANPSSSARGSQTATNTATVLAVSPTAYTGGVDIWNSSTTDSVTIGTGTPADGAGANKTVLGPGQGYHEPSGDLSALKIIAASGAAVVNWVGSTR